MINLHNCIITAWCRPSFAYVFSTDLMLRQSPAASQAPDACCGENRRLPNSWCALARWIPVILCHPFIDVLEYRASYNILRYDSTRYSQDWYIDLQWFTLIYAYLQKMILLAPCHEKDTRFQQRCAATKIGRLCLHSGTIKRRPIPNHPRNTGSKIP